MKLKPAVLLFFLFLFFSALAGAQTLYFCEGVDEDGYPESDSRTFTIPEDGGYLYFLVRMPDECDTYSIDYVIYKVGSDDEETYDNTISQDTEPDWTYFWKEVNFYDSGRYKVYVYNDADELLASGSVKIKFD